MRPEVEARWPPSTQWPMTGTEAVELVADAVSVVLMASPSQGWNGPAGQNARSSAKLVFPSVAEPK
nr:hypothetical protein GCM10017583_15250 [Agromyces mediolanus]